MPFGQRWIVLALKAHLKPLTVMIPSGECEAPTPKVEWPGVAKSTWKRRTKTCVSTVPATAELFTSMTFDNATFASLGVTPGTYEWTWGTGLANQNFTLIIGGAGVPDGGSTVSLLGFGFLGLAALRRKFCY